MASELRWLTEKREWQSLEEYLLFLRHKKAYEFAGGYCEGKRVLDYGCGGGYGSDALAGYAREVLGVDVDGAAIEHAQAHYGAPNLTFQHVPFDSPLPFDDDSFDVVASFQVIEHIPSVRPYLSELKRVLRADGRLLLTTPNRRYRLLPFQKPWNPEHVREYSARQLRRELSYVFGEDKVLVMGIHGSGEVTGIEHRRVRQRPVDVYLRRPAARSLRALLPESLVSVLSRQGRASEPAAQPVDPIQLRSFGLGDFCVAGDPDAGLDLIAICGKN